MLYSLSSLGLVACQGFSRVSSGHTVANAAPTNAGNH